MWDELKKEEIKSSIYWCNNCKVPVLKNDGDEKICPLCQKQMKKLAADVRPVFPEEVALVEALLNMEGELIDKSVWKGKTNYFVDGKPIRISNEYIKNANIDEIIKKMKKRAVSYINFDKNIANFIVANSLHLSHIVGEAEHYIKNESRFFDEKNIMVSFSGGKDSTVTSDLVLKTLNNKNIVHIFGDTTLEHDLTLEYINRIKREKQINIYTARNNDNNFYDMAEKIGPPSRMSRWCCYMFKTGAVNRLMNELFGNKHILTFYGIRKNESVIRSKYNRSEDNSEHKKIIHQKVCSPIFYWNEFEIWLYILSKKIDFNFAYRLGYSRVGCWCCPNASDWSEFLAKIYLKKKFDKWNKFLIKFATKINKENPINYIKQGGWKSRQGGEGLVAAKSVKLYKQSCTVQENGTIYQLVKPINDSFFNLFIPFGNVIQGNNAINETLIFDSKYNIPIISIQPLESQKVKIVTLNVKNHKTLQNRISHQIIKFNACNKCLKCESVCPFNAIKISNKDYKIDVEKCRHCQQCVSSKNIPGGCLMCRYLRTKGRV